MLNLGYVLIVQNLGVQCLIGEPGIESNNIICLPQKRMIILAGGDSTHHTPYLPNQDYVLARAISSTTLYPGEQLVYSLPAEMKQLSYVTATPRQQSLSWLEASTLPVKDGNVFLTNCSSAPVKIKKMEHLADIRDTKIVENSLSGSSKEEPIHSDSFQFQDLARKRSYSKDYLQQIQVDPDNTLTEEEKQVFHEIHRKYVHLFTPQPGRYNGSWGYVDNKLQFSTPPAPNARTYVPNYSPTMNQTLAQKMDTLEEWGVLVSPEKVGVSAQFVSPSMLVPKPDSNDFRLVTDFSALNVYLKRIPNTSASIAQAKSRIAKANYVIHLDLANYFYQCGMQKSDIKYLATVHPFKGLKVYTCDPQGLKGASERSYEKLLRIYGDMVQAGQLAQMADGLHILGDSLDILVTNYEEVLKRADMCNLTFKPSKVVVCPKNINLFGWSLKGHKWFPTSHTISALANAQPPTTVKQLRSFLGSFKQLSPCLPNYASTINTLEQMAAGMKSGERISWTEELNVSFEAAKRLAASPVGISEPRPDDELQTYSDYSADCRAVGGRLVILRKMPNGETVELVGGFYSAVLNKHKRAWLPCEGEAAAIRLVLEHFKHHIRESQHTTVHFTDSQPCVLAWKRSLRGAFSASARISAFLTGLSTLPIELRHRAGKLMHTSDYASRHPQVCTNSRCQICTFVHDWEKVGDKAAEVRSLTIEDIKTGRSIMPLTQRNSWKNMQRRDPIHSKLLDLINNQQLPEAKKTNGIHTKLKLLHNQYTQGKLFVDKDGLIMIRTPEGNFNGAVISIPPSLFPGLASALHIQLDHPSRPQLTNLLARYFYMPGWRSIVDEISEHCHQCAAIRKLPKVLLEDTSQSPVGLATDFAADVIERNSQKILVLRENLSQYTRATIIEDQTADTLRKALLSMILDILPESGASIRVDAAPSFQTLHNEANTKNSILNKLNIRISIGRVLNKNKNPVAENANQELQKEILRLTGRDGIISTLDLMLVLRNINARIRQNGYTPKEILFRRNLITNEPISVDDDLLIQKQQTNRKSSSKSSRKTKSKTHSPTPNQTFKVGDLVFLRGGKTKNTPRELHIVESKDGDYYLIRKFQSRLRQRLYKALPDELIIAPSAISTPMAPQEISRREEAIKITPSLEVSRLNSKAKPLIKFGWIEEDQNYDCEETLVFTPIYPHSPDLQSASNSEESINTSSETLASSDNTDVSSSSSDDDLIWDTSPEQYALSDLSDQVGYDDPSSFQQNAAIPPSTLSRRYATSEHSLVRSDAFKSPPDTSIPLPRRPDANSHDVPIPIRSSRIPTPVSPSQVNLHEVNDLSALPSLTFVPSKSPTPAFPTGRRSTRQPFNYKTYHTTGKKNGGNEKKK